MTLRSTIYLSGTIALSVLVATVNLPEAAVQINVSAADPFSTEQFNPVHLQ